MKVISRVVVFSAAFALGAVAGSLFSTNTVQLPYPTIQVIDDRPAHSHSCRRSG
ncbi:MAG TPA: hypothetical protein VL572_00390 [Pyrinomonadaceae bacterium]|nr:hypothetical protein [Pyrinomonadaceae bacterium]